MSSTIGSTDLGPKKGPIIDIAEAPKAGAKATEPVGVQELNVDKLHPFGVQPRKIFDKTKMEELAASIREYGVQQALKVRPAKDGCYEIIYGERRWRAAKMAGLKTVPCVVEEMGDLTAQELRLLENVQREGLNPLEEAQGYHDLQQLGQPVEEIARKIGKSVESVYGRIKLLQLSEAGKETVQSGVLPASTALLVARIPDPVLRENALNEVLKGGGVDYDALDDGGLPGHAFPHKPLSYRQARLHIEQNYMVRLKDIPFSAKDAALVPEAGPCTTCPKRSGNMQKQFPDLKSADVCTDVPCFETKRQAAIAKTAEKAKAEGAEVLRPSQAKKILESAPGGAMVRPESGYLGLDEAMPDNPKKTWRDVLPKDVQRKVAIGEDGKAHDVVSLDAAKEALKASGKKDVKLPRPPATPKAGGGDAAAEEQAKREYGERVSNLLRERLVEKVEASKETITSFLRVILGELLKYDDFEIGTRRGFEPEKREPYLRAANEGKLRGMLFEYAFGADMETYGNRDRLKKLADRFSLDLRKIEKEVTAAMKEAAEKGAAEKKPEPTKRK